MVRFIKVVVVNDDGSREPSLLNLNSVERFAVINKGTVNEHVVVLYIDPDKNGVNWQSVLGTPMKDIVTQINAMGLISNT